MNNEEQQTKQECRTLKKVKEELNNNSKYLIEMLDALTPNPKPNDFPDFIMPDGFLELFLVTSSTESKKKGAEHIKRQRMFESRSNEIKEVLSDEDTFARHRLTYSNNHLKENLLKSCKKNIDTHIQKLKTYKGNKTNGIFLIEYNEESAFSMAEVISVSDANHVEPQIFDHYVFSKDKDMLQLLNDYNEEIEFFIVSTKFNGTEVIKVRDIPNIIDSLPYEYIVASNYGVVETEAWVRE
ncbi:hypothetical protein [Enterococcus faecalis]|uniref:hypothetical protein n=1 Tax=Enterococcus faecalis TaxID=1351 RepID=UPI003D2D39E6